MSDREFILTVRLKNGFVLKTARWPFVGRSRDEQRNEIWECMEWLRVKRLVKPKAQDERFVAVDPELFESYPQLYGFLCDSQYDPADGGGARALGSLSVWVADGLYRAKLNDKDSASCCYVAGSSWGDLWAAIEAACSDPDAGWKPDPSARQAPKKK